VALNFHCYSEKVFMDLQNVFCNNVVLHHTCVAVVSFDCLTLSSAEINSHPSIDEQERTGNKVHGAII
jgi:hypothetical protein